MLRNALLVLIAATLFFGCAPPKFIPREPLDAKFDKTPLYSIDLSKIPKPEQLKPIFVDENFKVVPMDEAKYILLAPKEYAKVAALVKLAKAYKNTIKEQETLVNAHVQLINALKEYVALEQAKAKEYRQMWADSENAYRQERYAHRVDNAVNKGMFSVISIGSILMLLCIL